MTLARAWTAILRTPARVYHAHNIHTGPACWLASRLRHASLVYDGHELYGERDGSGLGYTAIARGSLALERFMVRRSDAVITTNDSRAAVLRERHGRQAITVLANFPELRGASEAPVDMGFPEDGLVLLYHGGIYAHVRAFRETIGALRMLPDVHFVIVGFGRESDLGQIRAWAAEAGVADRVQILPPRPFDELVRIARSATVGLVPIKPVNLGCYLGDTNKLFEYLAAGLPVVASDLPEIRRVVTLGDPQVGELFDPDSSESIAAAIDKVVRDPAYGKRRREAERLSRERFTWSVEEGRLLELYDRLAGDDRHGSANLTPRR
jgi:glycosyltransferase involved in cell wall biosynthesis